MELCPCICSTYQQARDQQINRHIVNSSTDQQISWHEIKGQAGAAHALSVHSGSVPRWQLQLPVQTLTGLQAKHQAMGPISHARQPGQRTYHGLQQHMPGNNTMRPFPTKPCKGMQETTSKWQYISVQRARISPRKSTVVFKPTCMMEVSTRTHQGTTFVHSADCGTTAMTLARLCFGLATRAHHPTTHTLTECTTRQDAW